MEKIKIVLDTDMGSDCDDAGALEVPLNLAEMGEVEVITAVYCCSEICGAYAVKSINQWYGRQNIPVGRCDKKKVIEGGNYSKYTKPIMEKFVDSRRAEVCKCNARIEKNSFGKFPSAHCILRI